jgi:hypothetical protein
MEKSKVTNVRQEPKESQRRRNWNAGADFKANANPSERRTICIQSYPLIIHRLLNDRLSPPIIQSYLFLEYNSFLLLINLGALPLKLFLIKLSFLVTASVRVEPH